MPDTQGRPSTCQRPSTPVLWNDSPFPPTPTVSPEFLEEWGGLGAEISRDEFEAIYARADAKPPRHEPLSQRETLGLLIALHRSAGHAQDGVRAAGTAVLRGEKAPDDALARELGAMGLL